MASWLDTLFGETRARLLRLLRRPPKTVADLANALELTDNAVRLHLSALGRDGIVEQVGTQRDTGGKPARIYALTGAGEELFPKAYAAVLGGLLEEIGRQQGPARARELLRAVGERVAPSAPGGGAAERVAAAAAALRGLGGDVETQRTDDGWRLQGFGCPLSALTSDHSELCTLVQALVEQMTGLPVTECCDRSARPRCAFQVRETAASE